MTDIPADLTPDAIHARLRTKAIGRGLRILAQVGSTNDVALAAGRERAPDGFAVLADRQTAGRGRLGRSWESPPGLGIYTSVLLRPHVPPVQAPLLTLAVGIAVAETVQEVTGLLPRLKWPNDIQLDCRKIAGILVEGGTLEGRLGEVVVGVGINVNQETADFPAELADSATSLRLVLGRPVGRADLVAGLYNTLEHWYGLFCDGEWCTILDRGRQWSALLGQPVEVRSGAEPWWGLAWDLDRDGALIVRDGTGALRRVVAGDVSIRLAGANVAQKVAGKNASS
jgi:BirA family biotin operon repressor/biotin-[acetyl-CoA-carboxylase] ligase